MVFKETRLQGVYIIESEAIADERGFFARTFCRDEFESRGILFDIVQCNISCNKKRGTLRGMHYQTKPHEEAKLLHCMRGAMYDVVLDLRPDSSTFKQWTAIELNSEMKKMVYIPKGCAHGFQSLEDDTEVFYAMSHPYHPESSRGLRWNDPAFAIQWPIDRQVMSFKDQHYEDFLG